MKWKKNLLMIVVWFREATNGCSKLVLSRVLFVFIFVPEMGLHMEGKKSKKSLLLFLNFDLSQILLLQLIK